MDRRWIRARHPIMCWGYVDTFEHCFAFGKDYAIPLKDADDAWRKAYPELAEKFPEDEPAPDG